VRFSLVDDEAADLMIGRELALVSKALERTPASLARLDGEAAARLGDAGDDEVLKEASGLDIGLELRIRLRIARAPHVAWAGDELVERDGLDHGLSPDWSRCGLSAPVAHPDPAPSPLKRIARSCPDGRPGRPCAPISRR